MNMDELKISLKNFKNTSKKRKLRI